MNIVVLVDGSSSHEDTFQKLGRGTRLNGLNNLPSLALLGHFLDLDEVKKRKNPQEQSDYILKHVFQDDKLLHAHIAFLSVDPSMKG